MLRKLIELELEMEEIYSMGKVDDKGKKFFLNFDFYKILFMECNYDWLLFVWKGWWDVVGLKF